MSAITSLPKITHCTDFLGSKICVDEVLKVIKSLCTGKALGSDGLTAEFYKYFAEDLVPVLIEVFNACFEEGVLSMSQCLAIITLLFKRGDVRQTGNYRPISLTNCDYKILAYILTHCLEDILPTIIHPNQTAYMKKHFIGTNIRSVQDVITNLPSSGTIILFLDFKKAFDSVNHLFLFSLILHIGFPPDYVAWVTLLYNQALSVVRYCNWLTKPFSLCRGVRQGYPLSCHLFNIVRQVLIYHLRDYGYFEW